MIGSSTLYTGEDLIWGNLNHGYKCTGTEYADTQIDSFSVSPCAQFQWLVTTPPPPPLSLSRVLGRVPQSLCGSCDQYSTVCTSGKSTKSDHDSDRLNLASIPFLIRLYSLSTALSKLISWLLIGSGVFVYNQKGKVYFQPDKIVMSGVSVYTAVFVFV